MTSTAAPPRPAGPAPTRDRRRPLLPVVGADLRVPLADGRHVRHVDLDHAATTRALRCVADRVAEVLPQLGSVHRGAGPTARTCTALYEAARATVAAFLGARADDVCIVTRGTTEALNLLAAAVPAGGEVVFLDAEHHANLLPWRQVAHRCVPVAATLEETLDRLERELARRPAALLAVTGASNVTGEVLPVARLAALAHAHGARLALDAAQLAPHRRIDLAALGVDWLALSGHKLHAPFGAGVLVGRADWLADAPPHLLGGGAVLDVGDDGATLALGHRRHEAGTPNLLGAVALAGACEALAALPEGAVEEHEGALRDELVDGLEALPGVQVLRMWPDAPDVLGVATFAVEGTAPSAVAEALAAEHGVSVRDGRFCAHPLLRRLGRPEGAVRASLGLDSCSEDVERVLHGIAGLGR